MAFKHNDPCLNNAEADEPLFTLLARDKSAPELVEMWAFIREQRDGKTDQVAEARLCAADMRNWRRINRPSLHVFVGTRDGAADYVVAEDERDASALLMEITGDAEMVEETRWRQHPDEEPFGMTEMDEPGRPCPKRSVRELAQSGRRYMGGFA